MTRFFSIQILFQSKVFTLQLFDKFISIFYNFFEAFEMFFTYIQFFISCIQPIIFFFISCNPTFFFFCNFFQTMFQSKVFTSQFIDIATTFSQTETITFSVRCRFIVFELLLHYIFFYEFCELFTIKQFFSQIFQNIFRFFIDFFKMILNEIRELCYSIYFRIFKEFNRRYFSRCSIHTIYCFIYHSCFFRFTSITEFCFFFFQNELFERCCFLTNFRSSFTIYTFICIGFSFTSYPFRNTCHFIFFFRFRFIDRRIVIECFIYTFINDFMIFFCQRCFASYRFFVFIFNFCIRNTIVYCWNFSFFIHNNFGSRRRMIIFSNCFFYIFFLTGIFQFHTFGFFLYRFNRSSFSHTCIYTSCYCFVYVQSATFACKFHMNISFRFYNYTILFYCFRQFFCFIFNTTLGAI